MNETTKNSIVKALQKEFIRRSLNKYFMEKGFENFDEKPYPPFIADMGEKIEALNGLIEVKNFLEDINMENNTIKIGWNIFVLGNKRIFLGYSKHKNLNDVKNNSSGSANSILSIKKIIDHIVDSIGSSSKLDDICDRQSPDSDVSKSFNYLKPYKPVPDFRRRV
jgi:hypothetical protein